MNISQEKQAKPQIACDYPAIVEGTNEDGSRYRKNACLANLSASGLYMIIDRRVEKGAELSITIFLSNEIDNTDTLKIVTRGIVVDSEQIADGSCGIEFKFTAYRFK